jgi:oxygen-independent coproporphyrinogen-3 oxidase
VESDCSLIKSCGIESINLDLIAGLPGQTAQSWRESLDWIEHLSPPHVSVYLFELDADSRLGLEILNNGSRYGAQEVPSDDAMADFYEFAVQRLAGLGIPRYEISNFARPGRESLHNLKYWNLEPYAGFGADAHSFDGATRSSNVETAREYVDQMKASGFAESEAKASNPIEERFFVGLRLSKGIHPVPEEWRRFEAPIRRFVNEGLLETDGSQLRLTNRGVLLSNEVLQEFVNL